MSYIPHFWKGNMKRMKKSNVLITVMIMSVIVGLTGCAEKKGNKPIDEKQKSWSSEKLDENLVADFDAQNIDIDKAYVYECERTPLSVEIIKDSFFYSDKSEVKQEKRYFDEEDKSMGEVYTITSENGLDIVSTCEMTCGKTTEATYYRNFLACDIEAWDENNMPVNLGTDETLYFLDKSDVEEDIKKGLAKLMPDFEVKKMNFFTLTHEYLNEIQNKELDMLKQEDDKSWYEQEKEMARDWKEEEGAYYVTVEMGLDGMSVNSTNVQELTDGSEIAHLVVTMIYNKEGCVYLNVSESIGIKNKSSKEIISVAKALDNLKDDITEVILTEENVIESAELEYVPICVSSKLDAEILPMWVFKKTVQRENEKQKKIVEEYEYYYVNAVSGEVIH